MITANHRVFIIPRTDCCWSVRVVFIIIPSTALGGNSKQMNLNVGCVVGREFIQDLHTACLLVLA